MIKKFKCGLCEKEDQVWMARGNFRKHLREVHLKKTKLMSFEHSRKGILKQPWVIEEDFK